MSYESKTEADVTQYALEWCGVPSEKFGQHGYPDRIFFIPGGRPLLIEFKSPGKKPRKLQVHRIKQLKDLGYAVEVHDDDKEALAAIIAAVEAAKDSGRCDEIFNRACMCRSVPEARAGKDQRHSRRA